jgi:hypothetical protein
MVQCHIPPTKICVVFVVRYVVQTMKFHAKPGKRFFLVRIIRHIQMVLRQKVRVERHALIVFYRALLAWILYWLVIFKLILIIEIQIASNQYLNLLHHRAKKYLRFIISTIPKKDVEPTKKQASTLDKIGKTIKNK